MHSKQIISNKWRLNAAVLNAIQGPGYLGGLCKIVLTLPVSKNWHMSCQRNDLDSCYTISDPTTTNINRKTVFEASCLAYILLHLCCLLIYLKYDLLLLAWLKLFNELQNITEKIFPLLDYCNHSYKQACFSHTCLIVHT